MDNLRYVYIYLDPREPGHWEYKGIVFKFRPFYIGVGQNHRITVHLYDSSRSTISIKNNFINKIIEETQAFPIYQKIYNDVLYDLADEIEIDIISHFGRIDLGTGILSNATKGGTHLPESLTERPKSKPTPRVGLKGIHHAKSKPVIQMDKNYNILKKWESSHEMVRGTNFNRGNVLKACENGRLAYGYYWKRGESKYIKPMPKSLLGKRVFQYSLDGHYIQSFESIKLAAQSAQLKSSSSISAVCRGRKNSAGGFQWFHSYLGENVPTLKSISERPTRTVASYTANGELVEIYISATEAARKLGNVCRALKKGSTAYGLYWRYL